jgi:predicted methyltransferase
MRKILLFVIGIVVSLPLWAGGLPVDARIERVMSGDHRSEENIDRNRYRHPVGTLTFLGLEDGMTVMEIWPGGGWYTEILAPVVRNHGKFIAAGYDVDVADQPQYRYGLQKTLLEKFSSRPDLYDQAEVAPFSPPASASLGEPDSIDLLLTFRNTHGWVGDELAQTVFAEFARVLKPGGILGVVQHRAKQGTDPVKTSEMGYVSEQGVIDLARGAGLYLEARSEVNANPADTRDHKEGVWSLPPSLSVCRDIESEDEAAACIDQYREIGESDRMTLRFRKPLGAP